MIFGEFLSLCAEKERNSVKMFVEDQHGLYWAQTGMSAPNVFGDDDQEEVTKLQTASFMFFRFLAFIILFRKAGGNFQR